MKKLDVKVDKVLFYKNGWGIFGCKPIDRYEADIELNSYRSITIKGKTFELIEDNTYTIEIEDKLERSDRGDSYNIIKVHLPKNSSSNSQYNFLKTVTTIKQYESIIETFPPNSKLKIIDAIKNSEIDLTKAKGIGEKNVNAIKKRIVAKEEFMHVYNRLIPIGVTETMVNKIIAHYGNPQTVIAKINDSMYNLCAVKGLGFKTVDEYALADGEDKEGFKRIEACVNYLIYEYAQEGHSWTSYEEMKMEATKLLKIDEFHLEVFLGSLDLMGDDESNILNVNENQITNKYYYKIEKELYDNLNLLNTNYNIKLDGKLMSESITKAENSLGVSFTDEQRNTILESFNHGVYVINGKGGTGKCIKGDSLVFTDKGLLKIEDIPKYYHVNEDNESKANVISYNTDGEKVILNTSHFYNMGMSKTFKIKTKQGYEIEGTPEHPILIVNENGDLEFKQLQYFKGGEVLPLSTNNQMFGDNELVTEEVAYFMGLLTGDGHTSSSSYNPPRWTFTLTNSSKEIGKEFQRISKEEFGVEVKPLIDGNTFNYNFSCKDKVLYIRDTLNLSCSIAKDKKIPESVLTAPKNVVKAFIQGLFDTDGSVTNNIIEFSTASEVMAKQLHVMLLNFGIVMKLRVKYVKGYKQPYYILSASSRGNILKFYQEINFRNERNKQLKLLELIQTETTQNDNLNILTHMNDKIYDIHKYLIKNNIPTYRKKYKYRLPINDGTTRSLQSARELTVNKDGKRKSCSSKLVNEVLHSISHMNDVPNYDYLMNVTENLYIDYVDTIEESESIVYDFTVPKNHSFVANGIINHNTTIMKGITEICDALELSYQAVALSGRASQLLSLKGINASTIHRLLGFEGNGFAYTEKSKLPQRVIILEEASMSNAYLWHSIVTAMEDGSKLIIVGDSGQLSAIGNGDVLRDLLIHPKYQGRELKQIHRQAEDSGIIEVAGKIREGENITGYNWELKHKYGKNEDLIVLTYNNKDEMYAMANNAIRDKLLKSDESNIVDFQILVANKSRGEFSTVKINKYCQSIYNDLSKPFIKNHTHEFRIGDKVIVNGNKYKISLVTDVNEYERNKAYIYDGIGKQVSLYNGTIGIIKYMDEKNGVLLVSFEGLEGYVIITRDELGDIDLAYAITIHKSQGQSIKNVLVLLDYGAYKLLSKQLVYTAITRASQKCVMIAENRALCDAISNDSSGLRRSFVGQFIQADNN